MGRSADLAQLQVRAIQAESLNGISTQHARPGLYLRLQNKNIQ